MPLLAPLKPFFDAMLAAPAGQDGRPPEEARAAMHAMIDADFTALQAIRARLPDERDVRIPVKEGEIALRIYVPASTSSVLPCHLYFHGGGFWLGTLGQGDNACRAIATDTDRVVVSVDYRLAPEHKFPTAAEDCHAALLWVVAHADALAIDASRISVGGGSAGGNLAAAVTLMARDRGGPKIVLQILEIPVTDLTDPAPLELPDEGISMPSGKIQYGGYYIGDPADAAHPYASPLLAPDLTGLPPALIMTAQYDPLRPEGEAYARRLEAAGVPIVYRCWEGQFHGSQLLAALIPDEAAAYQAQIVRAFADLAPS